jgi:hypothetical protein
LGAEVSIADNVVRVVGSVWMDDGWTTRLWTLTDGGASISRTDFPGSGINNRYFISGTDVYMAGSDEAPGDQAGFYRKNSETRVACPGFGVTVTGIWVQGDDIYVCGSEGQSASYWLNGVKHSLSNEDYSYAITVSGSDVYATGYGVDVTSQYSWESLPLYWKNGTTWRLPGKDGVAAAIRVAGSDVFTAGWAIHSRTQTACYWINGLQTFLPLPVGAGTSIAVDLEVIPR